jgi:hypothetical protein
MAAYRELRLVEGMAYHLVVGPCREGSQRAWLLLQRVFRQATWGSRLPVLQRRMKR